MPEVEVRVAGELTFACKACQWFAFEYAAIILLEIFEELATEDEESTADKAIL